MNPVMRNFFYFAFFVIVLGILSPLIEVMIKPVPELPKYGSVVDFTFTDSNSEQFGLSNLENKIWVGSFFFTNCHGPCPMMSSNIQRLSTVFASTSDIQFVTITSDPENDTVETLSTYAELFQADTNKWHFLTGEKESLKEFALKGLKLGLEDDPNIHSTRFVLVDKQGQIRGYYSGINSEDVNTLRDHIDILRKKS